MASFVPVDHDPFAAAPAASAQPQLVPVDHDPFAAAAPAAAREPMADLGGPLDTGMNVPEKPATLAAQQGQLAAGRKPAVMFPQGSPEAELPEDTARVVTPRGVFHYDPSKFTAAKIRELSAAGRENEILGLGPVSKPEADKAIKAGAQPIAVTERQPDGTEVKAAVGTPETAKAQTAALDKTKTPGNTVQVESPESVVEGRLPETSPMPPERPEGIGLPATGPMPPARPEDLGMEQGPPRPPGADVPVQGLDVDPAVQAKRDNSKIMDSYGTYFGMLTPNQGKQVSADRIAAAEQALAEADERLGAAEKWAKKFEGQPMPRRGSSAAQSRLAIDAEYRSATDARIAARKGLDAAKAMPIPTKDAFNSAVSGLAQKALDMPTAALGGIGHPIDALFGTKIGDAAKAEQDRIKAAFPTDPGQAGMGQDLAEGAGSIVGFIMGGAIGRAAGLSQKATSMTLGGFSNADEMYREAEKSGATGMKKALAYIAGGATGMTEGFGSGRVLDMIGGMDKATNGAVRRYFGLILQQHGEEGLQEGVQSLLNDLTKMGVLGIDPGDLTENAAKNAFLGAILGGSTAGLLGLPGLAGGDPIKNLSRSLVPDAPQWNGDEFGRQASRGAPIEAGGRTIPAPALGPEQPGASIGQNPPPEQTGGESAPTQEPAPAEAETSPPAPVNLPTPSAQPTPPTSVNPDPESDNPDAPAPPVEDTPENRTLKAAGFSDEDIADLSPAQRAAELANAAEEGVTDPGPVDIKGNNSDSVAEQPGQPRPTYTGNPLTNGELDQWEALARESGDQADIDRLARMRKRYEAEENATKDAQNIPQNIPATTAGTRADPAPTAEGARDQVNTAPSPAQIEAGNYQKGHARVEGFDVSIENPKGSTRRGTDADGKAWESTLPADYGYIKGTKGADGDHVDAYFGPAGETGKAFVVEQIDPKTGKFDELKVVFGVNSQDEAAKIYDAAFSDGSGPARRSAIVSMSTADLKSWFNKGGGKGRAPKRFRGEAEASEAGGKITAPATPAPAEPTGSPEISPRPGWTHIGQNADGHPVYEDKRGVRSFLEDGVYVSETVATSPGGGIVVKSDAERGSNYKPVAGSAPEDVRSTVTDGKVDTSGNVPVVDDRERRRLENVRKMEAIEAEAKKPTVEDGETPQQAWDASTPRGRADFLRMATGKDYTLGGGQGPHFLKWEHVPANLQAAVARWIETGEKTLPGKKAEGEKPQTIPAAISVEPDAPKTTAARKAAIRARLTVAGLAEADIDDEALSWAAALMASGTPLEDAYAQASIEILEAAGGEGSGSGGKPVAGDPANDERGADGARSDAPGAVLEAEEGPDGGVRPSPDQDDRGQGEAEVGDRTKRVRALFNTRAFRKAVSEWRTANSGKTFDYPHPESEVAYAMLDGYEAAKAGRDPNPDHLHNEPFTPEGETTFNPVNSYRTGYVFGQKGVIEQKRAGDNAAWLASFDKPADTMASQVKALADELGLLPGKAEADSYYLSGESDGLKHWIKVRATSKGIVVSVSKGQNEGKAAQSNVTKTHEPTQSIAHARALLTEGMERLGIGKAAETATEDDFDAQFEAGFAQGNDAIDGPQAESATPIADLIKRQQELSLAMMDPVTHVEAKLALRAARAEIQSQLDARKAEVDRYYAENEQAAANKPARKKRTKTELAVSAATNALQSADQAMAGLSALFNDPSRMGSGPVFDENTWAKAKPMFIAAARKFGAFVDDVTALASAMVQDLRAAYGLTREGMERLKPYLRRFVQEVRAGAISLKEAINGSRDENVDRPGELDAGADVAAGEPSGTGSAGELDGAPAADGEGIGAGTGSEAGPRAGGPDAEDGTDQPAGGNAADGRPGAGGTGVADDGAAGRPGRKPASTRPNYHIADPEQLIGGTPKVRFARNRTAITALQAIQDEGRDPTAEELDAMAGYIGWGSFGQELFQGTWDRPRPKPEWAKEDAWLRQHLGKAEWESAQNSIINAHYTDPPTVQAMWDMVRAMGFKGGRVLEPSMGVGNFFGLMPRDLMAASDLTGIELDGMTGGMAKLLYPGANIQIKGYEKSKTPDNFYDVVIGNWPFANVEVPDRRYNHLSPSLHDYFFVKALDQVRPGGLVIGITSAGTMDKQGKSVRIHLAKNAELVASFRLPSGAFAKYAGTSVVTDIVILKKREAPIHSLMQMSEAEGKWIELAEVETPSGTPVKVNAYYAANPKYVLGTLNFGSGSTYGRPSMIVDRPADLEDRLNALPALLPADGFAPVKRGKEARFITNNVKDREGSIVPAPKGEKPGFYVVQGERLAALEDLQKYKIKDAAKTAEREKQIGKLVELRRLYGALIDAEREGAHNTEDHRKALKTAYDAFRKAHGPIGGSEGIRIFKGANDPFTSSLQALERPDGTPSEILSRATVRAVKKLDNPTVRDAFVMARNESLHVDLALVAAMAKTTEDKVAAELLDSKAIYRTPGGGYEVSDVFLSGNVRRKLREAVEAQEAGEDMAASIEALKTVLPKDVPYFQIEAQAGATWVGNDDYREFIREMLGVPDVAGIEVRYNAGSWKVRFTNRSHNRRPEAQATWGTPRYPFDKLVSSALNNQTIKIYDPSKDGPVFNEDESKLANDKVTRLREHFSAWAWGDPERRVRFEKDYNETMNAIATASFDGSFLEFPGMALRKGTDAFSLRQHQVNAIWRGVANGRGLYAHEVGTGKTYTMGGVAVESRRYGVARKPMILAHNANSASVAREIQEMYPGAKILYIDNLSPDTIEATLRRVANDEWDAVVMPHSVADRLSLREETLMELAREEIAALEEEAYAAADEDGVDIRNVDFNDEDEVKKIRSVTAKNLVKMRQRIIAKIQKMAQRSSRENAIAFEDLGIDMIIVDEAHEFKKPPIVTKMQLKGLNVSTSDRSISLKFLTDYVKKLNGGKGIHVFTGTPITNTLTEIYNMMRFVMEDQMKRDGIDGWDAWFNTFAAASSDVELTPTGDYEPVTRLSAFVNVAELRRMSGQFMDIVFADDMPEFKPRPTASGKTMADELTDAERAELTHGRSESPEGRPYKKVITDVGPMGPQQLEVLEELAERARSFKAMTKKDRRLAMLSGDRRSPIIVEGAAAAAGLDVRLFDLEAEDDSNSKVNRVARNVLTHYAEHPLTTQVVFVDQGYNDFSDRSETRGDEKVKVRVPRFNLVADLVAKLVKQGIPRDQIAIVNGNVKAEKRKEIADKMNTGETRVVIGLSSTLGVGVNMQANMRAMHHMDAPWMPGLLEQRNGRGHRQGNKWNTVLEYRYITEKLDGRRWQVLAVKDRFIKAFLKADESVRVIEGDAVDDSETADDISKTLADAAGDPRLMLINKFKADVNRLENRERLHSFGIFDAKDRAKKTRIEIEYATENVGKYQADWDAWSAARGEDGKALSVVVNKKTYTDRKEAQAAIDEFVTKSGDVVKGTSGKPSRLAVEVNGVRLMYRWPAVYDAPSYFARSASGLEYALGAASAASIESVMRGLPKRIDDTKAENADREASIVRMEDAAKQPFQQANALVAKRQMLADLERDLQANPVPAPGWLRHGAPLDTLIYVDGQERVVEGHRWTETDYELVTAQGPVSYLEAKDALGAPIFDAHPHSPPVTKKPDAAATPPAAPPARAERPMVETGVRMTPMAERLGLTPVHVAEIVGEIVNRVLGPDRRLDVRVTGELTVGGGAASGVYDHANSLLAVSMASVNKRVTAHHEAFHRLQALGVFNKAEIAILSRETGRMRAAIMRHYRGSLTESDLPIGETSAYAYGYYASARDGGQNVSDLHMGVRRLFDRVYQIMARIRNWAVGLGFRNAEDIFEDVRTGGRRGMENPELSWWTPQARERLWGDKVVDDPAPMRLAQNPDRTRTSKVIAYTADMFVRMKELEEQYGRDAGTQAFAKVYRALGSINTRISERIENMQSDELQPMLDLIEPLRVSDATRQAVGAPLTDGERIVHRFMYVRHAPERNAEIAAINAKLPDGGSGIDTAAAQAELAAFMSDTNIAAIERAADAISAMNEADLDEREAAGLMSAAQVLAIRQAYQHYVPLRGFEGDEYLDEDHGTGPGLSVAAREVPTMKGRTSLADSVVTQTVNKRVAGIRRAQKNRVDLMLFRLAQQMTAHYGKDHTPLLARTKLPMTDVRRAGQTVVTIVDQEYKHRDDVLVAKIDGKARYIEVRREPQLADALKNNMESINDPALHGFGAATRLLGSLWTVYNPFFAPVNFGRDWLDAGTSVSALIGPGGLRAYHRRLPSGLSETARYLAGRESAAFRQFREDGGRMSFAKLRDIKEIQKEIARQINGTNPANRARLMVKHGLENWNELFESAHRFALYQAALDVGRSRAEAARAALEGTMNFHRRGYGSLTTFARSGWPFVNPSIQAPLRAARLIKEAGGMHTATGRVMAGKMLVKGTLKTFGAFLPIGIMVGLLNYALGGDDDDKIPWWDKAQADVANQNNIMIYFGGKNAKGQRDVIKIPAFPEIMLPIKMGYAIASMFMGQRTKGEIFKDLANAVYALSPTHQRGITPSLLAIGQEIRTNQNNFGSPIHKNDDFGNRKGVPAPESKFAETPQAWQSIARALATATFGDEITKGIVNLHPEDVRHIARALSGGWYDIIGQVGSMTGMTPPEERAPVGLRRFYGDGDKIHAAYDRNKFNEAAGKANAQRESIRRKVDDPTLIDPAAQQANRGGKRAEIEAGGGALGKKGGIVTPAADVMDTGRDVLSSLYKRRDAISAGKGTDAEKKDMRAGIESQIQTTRRRYGQMVKDLESGAIKHDKIQGQLARERALARRGMDVTTP